MNSVFGRLIYADLDFAEIPDEQVPSSEKEWNQCISDIHTWEEIGHPEEAARELLPLAALAHRNKVPHTWVERETELIRDYALYRMKSLLLEGETESERVAAEYALNLINIDTNSQTELLEQHDWELSICVAIVGTLEGLSQIESPVVDQAKGLLLEFLNSAETRKRRLAWLAYLRLVQVIPTGGVPDALDTKEVRIALKESLAVCLDRELNLEIRERKTGWHELFPMVLAGYNDRWAEFEANLRLIMQASDVQALDTRRQDALRSTSRVESFATPIERIVLVELKELLGNLLSRYIAERETSHLRAYKALLTRLESLIGILTSTPSNCGTGLVLPVVHHMRKLLLTDYRSRLQQGTPMISVRLAKPYYPLSLMNQTLQIQLQVTNTGSLEALQAELTLEVQDEQQGDVQLLNKTIQLETIPVTTRPLVQPVYLMVRNPISAVYLHYTISWQGLADKESQSGELRIVAQRDVDWSRLNPYSLWPVEDLDRLKGRDQILDTITRGLKSGGSYYVTGQKRIGKSSIAKVVRGRVSEWEWLAVEMPWGEVAGSDLATVLHWLSTKIERNAIETSVLGGGDTICPSRKEFEDSYAVAFAEFRERFHSRCPGTNLLVVVDDFDELPEELYIGATGNAFFTILRAAVADPLVRFLFVGGEKLRRIDTAQGTRLNNVVSITVDYLDSPSDFRELVVYPVEGMLEFNEEAINSVFRVSAGNPFYATLLCRSIYDEAVNNRTAYIDQIDVERSVTAIADTASEGQFNHFWQDGDHVGTEQEQLVSETNARLLLALANCSEMQDSWVERDRVLEARELLDCSDRYSAARALTQLVARQVVVSDEARVRCKVPLLTAWLKGKGSRTLYDALFDRETRRQRDGERYRVSDIEISEVASGLVFANEQVNEIRIKNWLSQLPEPRDRFLAFQLLKQLRTKGYTSGAEMQTLANQCFWRTTSLAENIGPGVTVRWRQPKRAGADTTMLDPGSRAYDHLGGSLSDARPTNVFIVTLDEPGKSGPDAVRLFRAVTRLMKPHYGSLSSVIPRLTDFLNSQDDQFLLLLVNDLIASGESALKETGTAVEVLDKEIPGWDREGALFYVALIGVASAVESVRRMTDPRVQVLVGKELDHSVVALDARAGIFDNEADRRDTEQLVYTLGTKLSPRHPLGWSDEGLLVLLPNNCPNNTLPILWKGVDTPEFKWTPLFPRK